MKQKRSSEIKLVLIGVTSLFITACDDSTDYSYTNRDDCIKEWGEDRCKSKSSSGTSWWLANVSNDERPRTGTTSRAFNVSRSGFGSSSSSHSSSSSS